MILPAKHLPESRALLTLGGEILRHLGRPRTVSSVWEALRAENDKQRLSFDWFVLSLDLLYLMNAVTLEEGKLVRSPARL